MTSRSGFARALIAGMLLIFPVVAAGQDTAEACGEIIAAKERIYNFRPTQLSDEQQAAKSKELDSFWDLAKRHKLGVACLQTLLQRESQPGFFPFNAAMLLYRLDSSEASRGAVLHGVNLADLGEVDAVGYIRFLLQLGRDGVDISPYAAKYMLHGKVETYVPQHAMRLTRDLGAAILYGSMPADQADRALIPLLQSEFTEARDVAALMLAFQMTESSLQALRSFELGKLPEFVVTEVNRSLRYTPVSLEKKHRYSRRQVIERLRRVPLTREDFEREVKRKDSVLGVAGDEDLEYSAIATLVEGDLDFLRTLRRGMIQGVSDEAIYEHVAITRILRGVVNRLDLYRDVRLR